MSFEDAKKEVYSPFEEKCGRLLRDLLREKEKAVCSLCSESCTEREKTHKALQNLIETMVLEAINGADDKFDIFFCVLCPYFSTINLLESYSGGKTAKNLTKEMQGSKVKLLAILRQRSEAER